MPFGARAHCRERRRTRLRLARAAGLCVALAIAPCLATEGRSAETPPDPVVGESTNSIVATAREMTQDRRSGWVDATGTVVVCRGDEELRAERVRFNPRTMESEAEGQVDFQREDVHFTGDYVKYNFRTRTGTAVNVSCRMDPFNVQASGGSAIGTNLFVFRDAVFTTCTNASHRYHYSMKGREVTVVPGERIEGSHMVGYLGPVPVLYTPYFMRDLTNDLGFSILLGHSTEVGAFALSSYRYGIAGDVFGTSHLDYRTERGFGFGQDVDWANVPGNGRGSLSLYYMRDRRLSGDEADEGQTRERYRGRLEHRQEFDGQNRVLLKANHLSDPDILEDFFGDEHRRSSQPENFASYTYKGKHFTASALLRARLNEFYSSVQRLPELRIDFGRGQIGRSSLYYDGEHSAGYLHRLWKDSETEKTDYSAFRADSSHLLLYPRKYLGFLVLIPRGGYRGTYYSRTRGEEGAEDVNGPAGFRSLWETGAEVTTKAYKTWTAGEDPMRHVVEPRANYTYRPSPNLVPDDLYEFDGVDRLDGDHSVRVGLRNKLQVKRRQRAVDLVDLDINAKYDIERDEGDDPVEEINMHAEINPFRRLEIDLKAEWDVQAAVMKKVNTEVEYTWKPWAKTEWEHRYKYDDGEQVSNLLRAKLKLLPGRPWSFETRVRYEFEDNHLEEYWGFVQRNLDCLVVRAGVGGMPGRGDEEHEWRAVFEFWLTDFPGVGLTVDREYSQ
ncbi:MAG: LPS-assembly protein LptD [Lentisphaerae bacterium]|nr:LPS-assembly protein LptD [Lentisphaerota bacterium]